MHEITVKGIHKSLNENGYICGVPFAASVTSAIQTKPVSGAFLYGPAGTGKSFLPIVLSKTLGVEMFFYQCAPGTREDDLVLKMLPSETTKSGVEIKKSTVFKAAEASHKNKVMLVLDEWDKTRPTADGFFLDFLQYGRLSIPGTDINANLDNMFIFFTANDEREFHEALLRRFPKIDVNPLESSLVMSALRLTHDGHPHLGNAIKLYEKAVMSGMSKPATIQEIRQLLDAISFLGKGADWNSLVYQFVTKTPENHSLLKDAQTSEYVPVNGNIAELDSKKFTGDIAKKKVKKKKIIMPTKIDYLTKVEPIDDAKDIPSDNEIYGVYDYTDENYSMLAHQEMRNRIANDDVAVVDDFEVIRGKLIRKKPYQLTEMSITQYARDAEGITEVAYVDKNCTFKDLSRMPNWTYWTIRRYSKDEVVARYQSKGNGGDIVMTVDMRWTKDDGITVIIAADSPQSSTDFWKKRGNVGQFLNVSEYGTENASLALFSSRLDNGRYNGILNIRNIITHEGIEYSAKINENTDRTINFGLSSIASQSTDVITDSVSTTYIGRGFEVGIFSNDATDYAFASVNIDGNPTRTALEGIYLLTASMMIKEAEHGELNIPVYKAVKVNSRKLANHLKKRGWRFLGKRLGMMGKRYKSTQNYMCYCFLFENLAIFGFSYDYDDVTDKSQVFSRMRRIVSQLAEAASVNV